MIEQTALESDVYKATINLRSDLITDVKPRRACLVTRWPIAWENGCVRCFLQSEIYFGLSNRQKVDRTF